MTLPRHRAALLITPVLLLALAGCSASAGSPQAAASGATDAPNASAAAPSATLTKASTATLGQTYTYDDGLQVTVTDLGKFTPSTYASKKKAKRYEAFQVTIKNGTGDLFDTTLSSVNVQDGEEDAQQVFDSENGFEGSPQTKLLDGRTKKWKVGFGVNTSDLVVQVRPDFNHDDALFTSK